MPAHPCETLRSVQEGNEAGTLTASTWAQFQEDQLAQFWLPLGQIAILLLAWLEREVRFAYLRTLVWSLQRYLALSLLRASQKESLYTGNASVLTSQGSLLVTGRALGKQKVRCH